MALQDLVDERGMAFWQWIDRPVAMASRWRRRQVCELRIGDRVHTVALRDISGKSALLEIGEAAALGTEVELRHPHAGAIAGQVSEIGEGRVRISFDRQEKAVAFALGAIVADMTRD
jgi:hypothetical protein